MTVMHNDQTFGSSITEDLNLATAEDKLHGIIPASLIDHSITLLLQNQHLIHHPKAGLNPIADAASYLFSLIAKLKTVAHYPHLENLHTDLKKEIQTFEENVKNQGYNIEYLVVCRYVMCATIDDILSHTDWGNKGTWESFSLLPALNQDSTQEDKFFDILERAIKDPTHYIDLMELMYLSLSMGYKGSYRHSEKAQEQLEQITHNLYKHIRVHRGSFSKILSPTPFRAMKLNAHAIIKRYLSPFAILFFASCIVMIIFIGLSYLMDIISNEAYRNITQIQKTSIIQANRQ